MAVPTMPMIRPCIMKIVVTLLALAPMVLRIAMSRFFSITSRTSEVTIFSAATVDDQADRERDRDLFERRAENSGRFISFQSCFR